MRGADVNPGKEFYLRECKADRSHLSRPIRFAYLLPDVLPCLSCSIFLDTLFHFFSFLICAGISR